MTVNIIRTSDRGTFKRCRQLWDFTSLLRGDFEYVPGIKALDFGIAYHAALEVYYDPDFWDEPHDIKEGAAIGAFKVEVNNQIKRIKDAGHWNEEMASDFKERIALGLGMLNHYFLAAPRLNKGYRPVKSEITFEVPIPAPRQDWLALNGYTHRGFDRDASGNLLLHGDPVVYKGRLDLILEDEDGLLWILDHKTAAQFGQTEHLDLDPQCGSYVWAIREQLGILCAGVIYSEHRKKVPKPPAVLKNGALSKAKNQGTSYDLYLRKLVEMGYSEDQILDQYGDILEYLRTNDGVSYFRRTVVHRSTDEMKAIERNISLEAIDMLGDPLIYPNPSRWNCNGCAFRTPCLIREEGGDWEWHLKHSGYYIHRGGRLQN